MQTSDFFDKDTDTKEKQLIDSGSSTSITYKLSMDGRLYFMKQLRPEYSNDPRYRSLFFKEYECGKAISHPYVVRYTDMGEDEEGLYIIMEYVNGISIKEKLLHEPTYFEKEENLYKLVQQLLEALQTLHQQNVVYMDMSPTNILLTKVSNDVKLIDLGFCISDPNDFTGDAPRALPPPKHTRQTAPYWMHAPTSMAWGACCNISRRGQRFNFPTCCRTSCSAACSQRRSSATSR